MSSHGREKGLPGESVSRRYAPLGSALLAVLMAMFVLPSALNVPQSNPTQTLEFAPIPPEDDTPPPPEASNLESLSLGSSSTAPAGDAMGGSGRALPPPPIPDGAGERPITKRCVGNPPRQTEDPSSPPCVAHFDGDNGGSTATGVTPDEIRIVVYLDPANRTDGTQTGEGGELYDLGADQSDETMAATDRRVLTAGGFHAIPAVESPDPTVPACFYRPADYTCIKDATKAWWDPSGVNTNGTTGCWRLYEGGRRYFAETWPDRDIDAGRTSNDPCNLQGAHAVNA